MKMYNTEREKELVKRGEARMYKMEAPRSSFQVNVEEVASPTLVGNTKPAPASRTPSQTLPFIPPPKWVRHCALYLTFFIKSYHFSWN